MEKNLEFYKGLCQEISDLIVEQVKDAKEVRYSCGGYYPQICFITIDALDKKDYPHGISENSVFLMFKIDFEEKKFELMRSGHVYLSPKDLKTAKYRYLCMKSMTNILVDKGGKKFRKSIHKDAKTTAKKMADYFNEVMKAVKEYTGSYPFKQGIEE